MRWITITPNTYTLAFWRSCSIWESLGRKPCLVFHDRRHRRLWVPIPPWRYCFIVSLFGWKPSLISSKCWHWYCRCFPSWRPCLEDPALPSVVLVFYSCFATCFCLVFCVCLRQLPRSKLCICMVFGPSFSYKQGQLDLLPLVCFEKKNSLERNTTYERLVLEFSRSSRPSSSSTIHICSSTR